MFITMFPSHDREAYSQYTLPIKAVLQAKPSKDTVTQYRLSPLVITTTVDPLVFRVGAGGTTRPIVIHGDEHVDLFQSGAVRLIPQDDATLNALNNIAINAQGSIELVAKENESLNPQEELVLTLVDGLNTGAQDEIPLRQKSKIDAKATNDIEVRKWN